MFAIKMCMIFFDLVWLKSEIVMSKSSFAGRIVLLIFSLFILGFHPLSGQNKHAIGFFPTIDHSGNFTNKWSYNSYNFAANNIKSSYSTFLYVYTENGLHYQLHPKLTLSNSFVYERQEPFNPQNRNEYRLFQQLTLKNQWGKVGLKNRFRIDERWVENTINKRYQFSTRLRYLIGYQYDLNPKKYITAYTEAFFATNNQFKFNENWSAVQIGHRLNAKNSIEIGYLFVSWIYNNNNQWFNQHYLQFTWVNKL